MSSGPAKILIKVESSTEQEENLKNSRKTLKILQKTATDKENLTCRKPGTITDFLTKIKSDAIQSTDTSRKQTRIVGTQTEAAATLRIIADLTTEENPSEIYWQTLAEKRREALEESLTENEHLHERVGLLEEELNLSRQMLDETRNLVEVLTEMLQDVDEEAQPATEDTVNVSQAIEADECDDNLADAEKKG